MPSLVHEGIRYVQSKHSIQCKKCFDTIESKSVHDYVMCSCGAVGLDGGISPGNRVIGQPSDILDKSVWRTEQKPYTYLPETVLQERWHRLATGS